MKLNSISVKLTATMAVFCILASGISALIGYNGARKALIESTGLRFETILGERSTAIETWLEGLQHDAESLAQSASVLNAVKFFGSAWDAIGEDQARLLRQSLNGPDAIEVPPTVTGDVEKGLSAYASSHDRFHAHFKDLLHWYGLYDIFLFDTEGNLLYTVVKEPDFAANFAEGQYADSGLGRAYRAALASQLGEVRFESFAPYVPSANSPAAFMATPIVDRTGQTIGVFAFQVPDNVLSDVANTAQGLGETGEVILFDKDGHRLTAGRHEADATFWAPVVETPIIAAARLGEPGVMIGETGQEGQPVMATFMSLRAFENTWYAVIEADSAEVMQPVAQLRNALIWKLAVTAVIVAALSYLLSLSVSRPLVGLSRVMNAMAGKDYSHEVPAKGRGDEIGAIAQSLEAFRGMLVRGEETAREVSFKSAAFSNTETPMMIIDRDLVIQYHNDAVSRYFSENVAEMRAAYPDFDPDRLIGTCIDTFHKHPAHQRQLLSDPANLPHTAEIRLSALMIKLRIYPVRDAKGAYVGNVLEWLDVGEAQINAGTLDSLRQNQILVEYDMEGRVAKGNTRFCRSFGFSEDEAVGKRFADLFEEPAHAKAIWDEVRSGGFRTEKTRRRNKNGDYVCIESSISLVKDNTGKPYRIIEIGADVTEIEAAAMEARRRREEMEQSQKHVVAELRRGLAALSHGDLSVTLDQRFASEYEELRSDFNATVTTLMTTLQQLMDVARNIRNGTVEISQAADDLSRRTENQAATLEETAAALEEMTESVRSAAEGASKADTIVKDARENAIASGNVVLEAVDAMNQIESSSKQISQIIGVIDDIAFQTNLLALNAGVEAARAGDAGRGFAVVASEVRALAQRSSDAAKEIKTLISQSSQHVETGVTLVGDAGGALQQIVENVSNISSLVSEIATSSREQSTGLGEINTGVNHLDQVTQQNAAMVEESTAASHSMKQEAENLASLIAVFNLGDGHHQVVAPKKADPKPPVKAAAKPAASSDWGTRKAVGSDVAPQTDWIEF